MNTFARLAPFIRDYIYKNKWEELRDIQVAACDVIFNGETNLLLASATASGKTEAAFLPTLTKIYEDPPASVGILYISPLKALINDQFYGLDGLLAESKIPVCKWHGDVSASKKKHLLEHPSGVLQTTPESLEALLLKKKDQVAVLFSDLRYVIIDEVHYFMGSDRGTQLLCLLERIQKITGRIPIRIGLSATLGDYTLAENWLNSGTGNKCITPQIVNKTRTVKLLFEYFPKDKEEKPVAKPELAESNEKEAKEEQAGEETKLAEKNEKEGIEAVKFYNFIYANTLRKKSIIFANSKKQVERTIFNLKKIAAENNTPDKYLVHHGDISAERREFAEKKMKLGEGYPVIGATNTLELGIDIGGVDSIIQENSPYSVASFVQRLGRSGRRNKPSTMAFAFYGGIENSLEPATSIQKLDWDFLLGLAIAELYLRDKWLEPIKKQKYPLNVLYQQTMSILASNNGMAPALLAQNILKIKQFENISQTAFKTFLNYLILNKHLEIGENNFLYLGEEGEKITNNYKFLATFSAAVEFSVSYKNQEIGKILGKQTKVSFPVGKTFLLDGKSWETIKLLEKEKLILVKPSAKRGIDLRGAVFQIDAHSIIMKKIKELLTSNENITYLSKKASEHLEEDRTISRSIGILQNQVVEASGGIAIFPWLGVREMKTLEYCLKKYEIQNCTPITVKEGEIYLGMEVAASKDIAKLTEILTEIKKAKIDKASFELNKMDIGKYQGQEKFRIFAPEALVAIEYLEDYLDVENLQKYLEF